MVGGQPIPREESFVKEIRNASETPLQYKTIYWTFVGVNNWTNYYFFLYFSNMSIENQTSPNFLKYCFLFESFIPS